MTEYVILEESEGHWERVAAFNARSSRAAIRQLLEDMPSGNNDGFTYVAVPARSWKPVTVSVETKTLLKFD